MSYHVLAVPQLDRVCLSLRKAVSLTLSLMLPSLLVNISRPQGVSELNEVIQCYMGDLELLAHSGSHMESPWGGHFFLWFLFKFSSLLLSAQVSWLFDRIPRTQIRMWLTSGHAGAMLTYYAWTRLPHLCSGKLLPVLERPLISWLEILVSSVLHSAPLYSAAVEEEVDWRLVVFCDRSLRNIMLSPPSEPIH